jgi:hypothetical protein
MKGYGSAKRKVGGGACTFVLAATRSDPIMILFMAALGGATVGFLVYNFSPASIFMGDTGSMFLGYVLAVGSIQTSQKSSTAVAILIPIVTLGLPIADTLLAMIRRAVRHQPMFSADRASCSVAWRCSWPWPAASRPQWRAPTRSDQPRSSNHAGPNPARQEGS